MEKIELLSPAGNKESLYMAVHAGADAVYLSGKKYGARKFATNFSDEEIIDAINYCHMYGVKVYATLNTLIFESEIEDFINYAKFLYLNNIDAVIVQDIGMIKLLREVIPDLEIHASTQTHNYNIETTKMFKSLGVKRVVLARELTIDEIMFHSKLMDTEVFVHGALCMSYSGCCYMSLLRGGRSGNRGECAGSCRLPYNSSSNNKYILSTKDLCNIYDIDKIIETNTKSIKIEGRMKSKEYVYLVTKLYRETIDKYYETGKIIVNEKLLNDINKVFNREYTKGHKFNDKNIMNPKLPNHQGILIGQAISVTKQNINIKLYSDVVNGDGIKFINTDTGFTINNMYINGKKINSAKKGDIISVKNTISLNTTSPVVKTTDKLLIESLKQIEEKKINLDCNVNITENSIKVEYSDGINRICKISNNVEKAINVSITQKDIEKQLSKLGNTPFRIGKLNIEMPNNIFINIKELNELRRNIVDELIKLRTCYNRTLKENTYNTYFDMKDKSIEISVSITNEEQYNIIKDLGVDNIYTDNLELYKKYKNDNMYYIMPRIIDNIDNDIDNMVINDYNYLKKNSKIIGNYYMNLTNSISCKFAYEKGVNKICVSPDLNMDRLKEILNVNNNINFEVQIYGSYEVMITKNEIKGVKQFSSNNYKYNVLNRGNYYSVINESNDNIHLIKKYYEIGVRKYRIDFYDEKPSDIKNIIKRVKHEILTV